MSHIFISYSHKDGDYAHKLADELEQRGFSVWIDDRIDYGVAWPDAIEENLDSCAAFIVILSSNARESIWVKNELARAQAKNKPLFPLLLDGDGPWLSVQSIQYADVRDEELPPDDFYRRIFEEMTEHAEIAKAYILRANVSTFRKLLGVQERELYRLFN